MDCIQNRQTGRAILLAVLGSIIAFSGAVWTLEDIRDSSVPEKSAPPSGGTEAELISRMILKNFPDKKAELRFSLKNGRMLDISACLWLGNLNDAEKQVGQKICGDISDIESRAMKIDYIRLEEDGSKLDDLSVIPEDIKEDRSKFHRRLVSSLIQMIFDRCKRDSLRITSKPEFAKLWTGRMFWVITGKDAKGGGGTVFVSDRPLKNEPVLFDCTQKNGVFEMNNGISWKFRAKRRVFSQRHSPVKDIMATRIEWNVYDDTIELSLTNMPRNQGSDDPREAVARKLYRLQQIAYTKTTISGGNEGRTTLITDPDRLRATIDEAIALLLAESGSKSARPSDTTEIIYHDRFGKIKGDILYGKYSEIDEHILNKIIGELIDMMADWVDGTYLYRHVIDRFMLEKSLEVLRNLEKSENGPEEEGARDWSNELYALTALVTVLNLSERSELENAFGITTNPSPFDVCFWSLPQILITIYSKYRSETLDRSDVLSKTVKYLELVSSDQEARRNIVRAKEEQVVLYEEGLQLQLIGFEDVISQFTELANHMFVFRLFGLNNVRFVVPPQTHEDRFEGREILLKYQDMCRANPEIGARYSVDVTAFKTYLTGLMSRRIGDLTGSE